MKNAVVLLVFLLFQTIICTKHNPESNSWKIEADIDELRTLISQPYAAVFFATTDGPQDAFERKFNDNFGDASTYLDDFGVKTGIVSCFQSPNHQDCVNKKDESKQVHFYRNGRLLTDLPLDTMFSFDAIVANILHLVLLQEVPLLQTEAELEKITTQAIGKHDVIFGRMKAVGVPEDRAFTEAAFAYNHLFKFVMATMNTNFGIDTNWAEGSNGVWLLKCKDANQGEPCKVVPFVNTINIENLIIFIRGIQLPNTLELSESSSTDFLRLNLPIVYLSGTSKDVNYFRTIINKMAWQYQGSLGFILIDRDTVTAEMEAQWSLKDFPDCSSVCAFLRDEDLLEMISDGFTEDELRDALSSFLGLVKSRNDEEWEAEEGEEYETIELYNTSQETQDDPVEVAVFKLQLKRSLNHSATEQLTDKTFPESVARSSVTFVLFTVKWSAVCLSFLETYQSIGLRAMELTGSTFNPLTRVECSNWPDVCDLNNVSIYPTLKMYSGSVLIDTYQGRLDETDVLRAYMLYSSPSPIRLTTEEEFSSVLDGSHPSWPQELLPSYVIGVFPAKNTKERSLFEEVTQELRGAVLSFVSSPESIDERFEMFSQQSPFVVTVKPSDPHEPSIRFSGPFTRSGLINFISNSSEYILPELTPASLPSLFHGSPSIVMLFHQRNPVSNHAEAELAKVAKARGYDSPPITWIDAQDDGSLGSSILRDYALPLKSDGPHLLYLNRKLNTICWYPHTPQYSENMLTDWLQSVLIEGWGESCAAALRHREWIEMVPGYDFLTYIREDNGVAPGAMDGSISGRVINRQPVPDEDVTAVGMEDMERKEEEMVTTAPVKSHLHSEL